MIYYQKYMIEQPLVKLTKEGTELFSYKGKQIETDRKDNKREDSVLPIYPGSGVHYLVDHLLVREGDVALDLCTGSGILGIYTSDKASRIIVTDINQRALEFAKRNAKRNNIKNIEFRQGDLFEPVKGEQFDYIVANPPFVPVPENLKVAMHSKGGLDGLYLVRKIIEQVETYLKPSGRMQLYSLTLGSQEATILEEMLKQHLKNRKITMTSMYSEPLPLEEFIDSFKQYDTGEWESELRRRGITHLYSYIVNIEPGEGLEIIKTKIPQNERDTFPDGWDKWKQKFSFWVLDK
jgi:release factor glutamine methyltransferase